MTLLLHRFPGEDDFASRLRKNELQYLFTSEAAQTVLAESYVGLPL
jgi:p-hydroxybenzoate 3-monooxygenase